MLIPRTKNQTSSYIPERDGAAADGAKADAAAGTEINYLPKVHNMANTKSQSDKIARGGSQALIRECDSYAFICEMDEEKTARYGLC
jgi:hypothetical protein